MPMEATLPLVQAWPDVLDAIKKVPSISHAVYDTFFGSVSAVTQFREADCDVLVLETPSSFHQNFLNTRYESLLRSTLEKTTGRPCAVRIITPAERDGLEQSIKRQDQRELRQSAFNPKYSFDSFVIGNSNRFAHAASLAVAEAPAMAYNPLFIYGGVGLGKTHLLHAIGQYVMDRTPDARVMYVSSEKFTNEFIHAIQTNTNEQFRLSYRSADVLLLDDVQFLAGKERTQEELFHTFNALHEAGKQIIFSSDRPPRQIDIEDRLRSRFQWGLIADIQAPDLETRIAILHQKANQENFTTDDDVYEFVAQVSENNIRELEGALNRVIAYSRVTQREPNLELAREALKEVMNSSKRQATPETIITKVSEYFNVDIADVRGKSKQKELVTARHVAMYLVRELTDMSLPKIGEFFDRDHTTVLHGWRVISNRMADDHDLRVMLADMRDELLDR